MKNIKLHYKVMQKYKWYFMNCITFSNIFQKIYENTAKLYFH